MRPTFEKTVDILVKAYLNDTLTHKTCGCAVHNIVEAVAGKTVQPLWSFVFVTTTSIGRCFYPNNYVGDKKEQIDSTGYSMNQLSDIEYAFERDRSSKDVFGCLMNVVDVLAEIHGIDLKQREEAKLLFQKV